MANVGKAFCIHPSDNVATILDDVAGGFAQVLGSGNQVDRIELTEPIALGHKVALRAISIGDPIIKFGVPIGAATRDIAPGEWVHLHNCASNFDERSGTLEVHTGATTDTRYE